MNGGSRIGIDARMIGHSGIGTYLRNLLRELPSCLPKDFEATLFGMNRHFGGLPESYRKRRFADPVYGVTEQIGLWRRTGCVDLWHAPHFNVPLACRSRLVVTVHDLIPWVFAGKFFSGAKKLYFGKMMDAIRRQASKVIAVSGHTKRDLMRYFGFSEDKIRVIHEGVSEDFYPVQDDEGIGRLKKRYGVPEGMKFILYVGLLKPHKNLETLIRAVKKLRREKKIEEKLVVIGPKDKKYPPEARALAAVASDEDLVYVPRAEFEDLPVFYNQASCLVQPSLYEGFGLPVLEAMACGTPVIVSDRASLPEIAGDAALVFAAESSPDLEKRILEMMQNDEIRAGLAEKGIERARQFSWKKMAEQTVEVYREVMRQ